MAGAAAIQVFALRITGWTKDSPLL